MPSPKRFLFNATVAFAALAAFSGVVAAETGDIVLVHGMNMDGGAWRAVYDRLIDDDYDVAVVQLPMTSIEDDIAAVRRAIDAMEGPVVLVGHSYGGMVVSQAGTAPSVGALVYVAAFAPDVDESLAQLNASVPAELPQDALQVSEDGFYTVKPEAWIADVANGLPDDEARYTAYFQTPVNSAIFGYEAEHAAWRDLPVWAAIARDDRTIAPELQRQMAERADANTVVIDGGHLLPMSHPGEVTALIEEAAEAFN